MHAKTQLDTLIEQMEIDGFDTTRTMKNYIMLVPNYKKGMDAVYSVLAASYDEARHKIVAELAPKLKRHPILSAWLKSGQPLRIMHERGTTTFKPPIASIDEALAFYGIQAVK